MSNLIKTLNSEITRIARKEIKTHCKGILEQNSRLRKELRSYAATVKALDAEVKTLKKALLSQNIIKVDEKPIAQPKEKTQLAIDLRSVREQLKISQKQLGEMFKVSPLTVLMWENGRTLPGTDKLPKVKAFITRTKKKLEKQENPTAE